MKKFLCLLLIAALLASFCGCASSEVRSSYRLGKAALSAGRLAEAAEHFGAALGYRDSERKLQAVYSGAMDLYDAGDYAAAADAFAVLAQYEIGEAHTYACVSGAYACLNVLDGAGARARLADADPAHGEVAAVLARLDQLLFEDTVLVRPEFAAEALRSGEIELQVSDISQDDRAREYLYTMTSTEAKAVYRQYREYCLAVFGDTFRDESDNYFSFRVDGSTYYVSNFHSVDGGLVILIPLY